MVAAIARIILSTATTGLLAACAGGGHVPDGPPEFQAGFVDGCNQGYYDGGYQVRTVSDQVALATDPVYQVGYEQGHATCYELQLTAPKVLHGIGGGIAP